MINRQVYKKRTPLKLVTVLTIITAFIVILCTTIPYHAKSKTLPVGDSSLKVSITLQNHVFFTEQLANVDDLLLSRVYVLNTGEIVAEKPVNNIVQTQDSAAQPSTIGEVKASFTVAASRVIVVDKSGQVTEIWSNARDTNCPYYSLSIRDSNRQGTVQPITEEIINQYNQLLEKIDWTIIGKVYCVQGKH